MFFFFDLINSRDTGQDSVSVVLRGCMPVTALEGAPESSSVRWRNCNSMTKWQQCLRNCLALKMHRLFKLHKCCDKKCSIQFLQEILALHTRVLKTIKMGSHCGFFATMEILEHLWKIRAPPCASYWKCIWLDTSRIPTFSWHRRFCVQPKRHHNSGLLKWFTGYMFCSWRCYGEAGVKWIPFPTFGLFLKGTDLHTTTTPPTRKRPKLYAALEHRPVLDREQNLPCNQSHSR